MSFLLESFSTFSTLPLTCSKNLEGYAKIGKQQCGSRLPENAHATMQALQHKGFSFQNCTYQTSIDNFLHDDLDRVPARILITSFNVINFLNMFIVLTLKFRRTKIN
jgi:hypothetical protein